jgi:hypothetical protein
VMEATNKCRLWSGNPLNQGASRTVKKLPIKYHANSKAWMTTEIFCLFLHSLDTQMGAQKEKKVKAFFYMHNVTDADRENILSLKKSYFQLRQILPRSKRQCTTFFV